MLVAVSLMAGSSMAAVLDVFGYDWTTNPAQTGDTYVKNSETSLSLGATDWASVAYVTTQGLSISVGDTVSYDRYISETGDWMSWYRGGPLDAGGVALDFYFDYTGDWAADGSGDIVHTYTKATDWIWDITLGGTIPTADNATGLHFDFYYDSATTYVATITDIVSGTVIASGSSTIEADIPGADITTIDGWLFAELYGTNEIRIENFVVTPEPATMLLLGLGGVLLRRKRA